jgi:hypothetical protein
MKKFNLETNGDGLWSNKAKKVEIIDFQFGEFNELQVYFTKKSWNPDRDGLIYTDPLWIKQLRKKLIQNGFSKKAVASIHYSEQGMQGDNYVSLDFGEELKDFIKNKLFGKIK